jgi:hypothetical protein
MPLVIKRAREIIESRKATDAAVLRCMEFITEYGVGKSLPAPPTFNVSTTVNLSFAEILKNIDGTKTEKFGDRFAMAGNS